MPTKTRLFFLKQRCLGIENNELQYNYNEKTKAPCWHDNANMALFNNKIQKMKKIILSENEEKFQKTAMNDFSKLSESSKTQFAESFKQFLQELINEMPIDELNELGNEIRDYNDKALSLYFYSQVKKRFEV